MKFYRLVSDKTHEELDELLAEATQTEFDYILLIYSSFDHIEWNDQYGYCCMYAILDEDLKSKLEKIYENYNIKFKFDDLTKEVLWGDFIETNYTDYSGDLIPDLISYFIEEYYTNYITVDIILDKINARGMHSLSQHDLKVLDGFT